MLEVLRYIAYIALNAFNCVHTKIKAMSKVSKICHRFQCIECYVCQRHRRWYLQLLCNTVYIYRVTHFVTHVEGVKDVKYYEFIIDQRIKIHTNMFLLITSLIFNGFSIRKKFWKDGTKAFSTIPSNFM